MKLTLSESWKSLRREIGSLVIFNQKCAQTNAGYYAAFLTFCDELGQKSQN